VLLVPVTLYQLPGMAFMVHTGDAGILVWYDTFLVHLDRMLSLLVESSPVSDACFLPQLYYSSV